MLEIVPVTLRQANEFVTKYHRHHKASRGHKFSIGVREEGKLVGVCICGRPVSRHLDDGNALVRNAKAKPIERTFGTVKAQFSKTFKGYCGGTIIERPESLKRRIKNGELPRDHEIRDFIETWIDGDYNLQPYGGAETCFKDMSRLDVWNKSCR